MMKAKHCNSTGATINFEVFEYIAGAYDGGSGFFGEQLLSKQRNPLQVLCNSLMAPQFALNRANGAVMLFNQFQTAGLTLKSLHSWSLDDVRLDDAYSVTGRLTASGAATGWGG